MKAYIDKSALVAELNRLIAELVEEGEDTMFEQGRISAFEDVKVFINHTLEMKEVEEEAVSSIWHDASEKSNEPEDIVIINPSDNTGEVLTKCTGVYQGRIWAYTSVLLNLDNPCKIRKNLQEELISNDIEAEFVLYLKRKFNIPQEGHKLKTNGWKPSPYDLLDIAKHFTQWQKKQEVKKVDLEKEIHNAADQYDINNNGNIYWEDIVGFAKHFFELGLKAKGE